MEALWQDLRYGFRALLKSPWFTIIAVVTLALGMAVNTTVFSVVNGMLLRPLPVPHPSEITVLTTQQAGDSTPERFSYPDYQDVQKQSDAFQEVFGYEVTLQNLAVNERSAHCIITEVTNNYFSALGIKPALGRFILPTEGLTPGADPVMVLGYSYWQKRFGGDPGVVGKQVQVNDHPLTIIGVAPKGFNGAYSVIDSDTYVPLSAVVTDGGIAAVRDFWTRRNQRGLSALGRLKPDISLRQARASLNVIAQRLAGQYPDVDKGLTMQVYPERLARPEPDPNNPLPAVAAAFMILAALVLLVACFNIANVLLVRATVRQREMAIRAALGAGRVRLVRQYLTESLLLAFLGGGAGLMLASWATGYLSALPLGTDLPIEFNFQPDVRVYFFALAAVILTGVIVGIIPAVRVARTDVSAVLHEGGRGSSDGPRRHFARNALVVAQVAGSLLLLIVAGLFVRSLGKAQKMYLGFNPDHVLDLTMDVKEIGYNETRGREFYRELETRLQALPGVQSVTQAFSVPLGYISSNDTLSIDGHPLQPGQLPPSVRYNMVRPNYFATLRIPLERGRSFTESDSATAPAVAVINQTMARRFWPNEDPIGKKFSIADSSKKEETQIVGIAQDGKYDNVLEDPEPFFYVPIEQSYTSLRTFQIRSSVPPENLELPIESEIHDLAPDLAVTQVQPMTQALQGANGFLLFRFGAQLTGVMGLLGLILAIVGVYSVVSYAAVQRTHEIGIRMALGAAPRDILRMVLRQGLGVVGIGVAVGLAIAFAGTRAIASLIVGVSPSDPLTFATVVVLLTCIALLACWIPARRATRVSPLVALRYE